MPELVPAFQGINRATLRTMLPYWMENLAVNLPKIREGKDITDLPKKKEPCIIVGAGPSLKHFKHLEMIANHGWNHPILSCDKVLKNCLEAGLKPYATATIDASPKIASFYSDKIIRENASNTKAVFNVFTNPSVVNTWENYNGEIYWSVPELDYPLLPDGTTNIGITFALAFLTKHHNVISGIGNVGAFLWNIATVLECDPIILVGLDFSEQLEDKADAVYFESFMHIMMKRYNDVKTAQDKAAEMHQMEENPDFISEEDGEGWLKNYYEKGKPARYLVNPVWKQYREKFAAAIVQSKIHTINCTQNGCLHSEAKNVEGEYILKAPNFESKPLKQVLEEY
jgi:hypothetical protein